jgi:hypothetical protein
MKQIIYKIAIFSLVLSSCTKNFQDINTDPNNIPNALPHQLLAPALVNVMSQNMLRNRNFNNELMQITVNMSDAEGQVFRYDYRSTFADAPYNAWYSELTNFKDIYRIANEPLTFNPSYKAISLICQSWVYSLLTDTFGDIPYFQSNQGKDSAIMEPAFDRQKDIYMDIFNKLDTANSWLTLNEPIEFDPIYSGNVGRWRKFGNSLYLRLLMRIAHKPEVAEFCKAKIKDIVELQASTYPIIANNDESAILKWTGAGAYVSPLMSVREQDFRAPAIGQFFIEHLVVWNDPRIDIPTYGTSGINRWRIAPSSGAYVGVPSGYAPGSNPVKRSYFYSTTSAATLMSEPLAGMILNYAEVKFMLAEAAIKGYISGSAETYFNDGVKNSITLWLPTWNMPVTDYLAAADMQWDEAASLEDKMEKIHLMKYYALFLCDFQQWFEYRRTGHPILPKGPGLRNNGVMPARMTYPVYVQSTNPTNYRIAVEAQGADVISTQVWWQKP